MQRRWRIKLWVPEIPNCTRRVYRSQDCKLCVIASTQVMASAMANTHKIDVSRVKWRIEKMAGHLNGWEKAFDNEDRVGQWVQRHGH